jgi:AsmA protein
MVLPSTKSYQLCHLAGFVSVSILPMKRLLIVAGIVVAVLVVAAVAAPLFINVDSFRPELEKRLSAALNRPVQIGKLDASIFRGGATAENIVIADDPAFNKGAFLKASSLTVGLRMIPLIFSREINVTSLTVEKPEIVLLRNPAGKWNYSSLGSHSASPATRSAGAAPEFSVDKFEIVDGTVRVGQSSGHVAERERVYQNVHLVARNISFNGVMPFTVTAGTPGGGALNLEGQFGPLDRADSDRTPMDATVKLSHADIGATGFLDPSSGLGGILDFDGTVKSDGKRLHSEGKAKANGLRIVKGGSAAHGPVSLDYRSDYNLSSDTGTVNAQVHTGNSIAVATGTVDTHGQESIAHLKLQGKDMAVNDVEGLLPAFGVVLPSGASLEGGVINMDLAAEGPFDRLVITGPLSVTATKLTGYNLGSKLSVLSALTGIKASGNDTLIQTLSSGLRVAPEGLRADNIVLDIPAIGAFTGNGVIANNNALNFQMLLKLSNSSGTMLGGMGGLTALAQKNGIPFLIQGKTTNPVFLPSLGGGGLKGFANSLLSGDQSNQGAQNGQQQQGLGGLLDQVLNKKKKQQ